MKNKILIALAALLSIAAADVVKKQIELPRARITARVVDEQNTPLAGAFVKFIFGASDSANSIVKVEGITGDDGLFSGEGYSGGSYGVDIKKDGYYNSGLGAPKLIDIKDGRWQPWDPKVTTVLRAIGKPVALYAKCVQTHVPVINQPCGYDLERGDWLAPHGTGKTADLIFVVHQEYHSNTDYDLQAELTFSHQKDGLQQVPIPEIATSSVFKWERLAPEMEFEPKLKIRSAWYPVGSGKQPFRSFKGQDEWQGYYFRVRTVEKDSQIVNALYGKIRGDIAIFPPQKSGNCIIRFTYYLNPTSLDRNLEWDPKRNLIPGLSWEENPREP